MPQVTGRHLTAPSPFTQVIIVAGGGAVARVPSGRTALGQRQAPFNIHVLSMWTDPADDDRNIAWTREFGAMLKPYATGRVYLNYIGDEGTDRVRAAFGPERTRSCRR